LGGAHECLLLAQSGLFHGPDLVDQFGQAAGYVDRILNGEKSADMRYVLL
jgi:hypothetical protein